MPDRPDVHMRHRQTPREREGGRSLAVGVGIAVVVVLVIAGVALWTFPRSQPESPSSTASSSAATAPTHPVPAPKGAGRAAPPLSMAGVLPGSRQVIVATGATLGATGGTLRVYNLGSHGWKRALSAKCRFGTHGLVDGMSRKQGTRTTPTGIWWPGTFAWGWHATPPSGTLLPWRQTTDSTWWSDESGPTYNTWVDSTQHVSGEHLIDAKVQYEYALSTGYNAKPNTVVEGRGTAIFLHVFDPPDYNGGLSAGCVTLSRSDMIRVLRAIDPARKPCFAIGTEATGTPSAITSY